MNEVSDKHMEGVDRYNELSKERFQEENCFLDRLMQIERCVINCNSFITKEGWVSVSPTTGCYERCGIKTMYNGLIQECVN